MDEMPNAESFDSESVTELGVMWFQADDTATSTALHAYIKSGKTLRFEYFDENKQRKTELRLFYATEGRLNEVSGKAEVGYLYCVLEDKQTPWKFQITFGR